MKRGIQNDIKRVNVYAHQMQLFVITNNAGMKINVGMNVKNYLIKVYVIKDFFGIQVIGNVNVVNLVILVNIQIIQIVIDPSVEECTKNIVVVKIDNENENKNVNKNDNKHKYIFFYSVHCVIFYNFCNKHLVFILFIIGI